MSFLRFGDLEIKEKQIISIIVPKEGTFEGKVETADVDGLITLSDVTHKPTGKKFFNCQTFHVKEVMDVDIIKPAPSTSNTQRRPAAKFNTKQTQTNKEEDVESTVKTKFDGLKTTGKHSYVIIDSLGSTFENSIKAIRSSFTIGLAAEGINVGRHGTLCWLSIEAQFVVYLFDMITYGQKLMDRGLRELLESDQYLKVVHDCRFLADALLTFYATNLFNVFDTQAAQAVLFVRVNGNFPTYVRPISDALISIGVSRNEFLDRVFIHEGSEEEDQACWKDRPMPSNLLQIAIANVKYLRKLRSELNKIINADVTNACELYLNCHRKATDDELKEVASHLLPRQFPMAVNIERRKPGEVKEPVFVQNSIRSSDRRLWYTRDSCHVDRDTEESKVLRPNYSSPKTASPHQRQTPEASTISKPSNANKSQIPGAEGKKTEQGQSKENDEKKTVNNHSDSPADNRNRPLILKDKKTGHYVTFG